MNVAYNINVSHLAFQILIVGHNLRLYKNECCITVTFLAIVITGNYMIPFYKLYFLRVCQMSIYYLYTNFDVICKVV